jgi:hypothetical protein
MSVGLTSGLIGSAAGAPLAQARGSELDRAAHEAANQQRQVAGDAHAESAAGIGETGEDQATSDRDADGRRLWERRRKASTPAAASEAPSPAAASELPPARDPTGESGSLLDLSG